MRRGLTTIGISGLALLGVAYWWTHEPAPRVRVLWREGVPADQQAALEREYLLRNGRDRLPEGSVAYDLLDTSSANIRALVEDSAIADTNDIERNTYAVPFDVDYGGEWMWIADRTPGLRDRRVRTALIVVLAAMAAIGLSDLRSRHRKHG